MSASISHLTPTTLDAPPSPGPFPQRNPFPQDVIARSVFAPYPPIVAYIGFIDCMQRTDMLYNMILIRLFARFLRYLRPYRHLMVAAYGFMVLHTSVLLVIPLFVRWIVDHGIIPGNREILIRSVILLSILAAARALFGFLHGRIAEVAAQRLTYDIRNEAFRKLGVMALSFIERMETGQILQRLIQDVERLRFVISKSLLRTTDAVLLFVGTLVFMMLMNPVLGLASLIPIPFLMVQAFVFGSKQRPLATKLQQRLGTMTSSLEQNLQGARLVKAFSQEQRETIRFQSEVDRWFAVSALNTRLKAIHIPLLSLIANLGLVIVIGVGGLMVIRGESIGLIIAFTTYLTQLFVPVRRIGSMLPLTIQGIASAERIAEIMDAPIATPEVANAKPLPRAHGAVQFRDISFSYDGEGSPEALHDINLNVAAGSKLAILGATGSGKTTLISLLLRLQDPTSGAIEIDGVNIREVTLASLRSQIGVVLQDTVLFAGTIGENIAFGRPEASVAQIVSAAETAQIHSFIEELPDGYETLVGERGATLSGGQKQRIAIARALLTDPSILILDDATSSVDARTEGRILSALRQSGHARTIFMVAHRASTCGDADAVLMLDEGRISGYGSHEELLNHSSLYRSIFTPVPTTIPAGTTRISATDDKKPANLEPGEQTLGKPSA